MHAGDYTKRMKKVWQIGNILSLIFALALNVLIGAQLLDFPAINDISDKYATYLTPAGYAFSIWSLIYLMLIFLVVYQARDLFRTRNDNDLPQKIGPFFIIASIANGLWSYVFVNELIGLSVVVLLVLTGSLYILLWRLNIALNQPPLRTLLFVWWPLLIYTGWVTVATVVNIASWFESLSISISSFIAVVVLISLGVGLIALLVKRHVRELLLACAWGIAAIGVQQSQLSEGSDVLAITAFAVALVLVFASAAHVYLHRSKNALRHAAK